MTRHFEEMTKAEYEKIRLYFSTPEQSIWDVYKTPSAYKVGIYERLRDKAISEGGYGFKVLTHSIYYFSVGWLTDSPNGGQILTIVNPTNTKKYEV